jgi:RHS repeat-associated protein
MKNIFFNKRLNRMALGFVVFCSSSIQCMAQTPTAESILKIDTVTVDSYQASSTSVQDVLPVVSQRGVGLDGSLRSQAPFGWSVNGNPFSHIWNENARYRDIMMLETGRYSPTEIDLALPSPGFRWTVGRTYSLGDSGGPSAGYQGANWQQFSQPELVYVFGGGAGDRIYVVFGADRFLEFMRLDATSDVYRGVNGAAGAVVSETSGSHDLLVYWDQHGKRSYFFDPRDADNIVTDASSNLHDAQGQLWKIVDPANNAAYVGDSTVLADAIEFGYDEGGRMLEAYDSAGRQYVYSYNPTTNLLESVEAFVNDGSGGWETTGAMVEYSYHTGAHTNRGMSGWLRSATVSLPLPQFDAVTAADEIETATSYYIYADNNNIDDQAAIEGVVGPEGYRRFAQDQPSSNIDTVSLGILDDYMSCEFEYYVGFDASAGSTFNDRWNYAIQDARFEGLSDEIRFSYYEYETFNHAANTGQYDSEHASMTVAYSVSGGASFWQYFDEVGQPLTRMTESSSGNDYVYRLVSRGEVGITTGVDGMIEMIAEPLACEFASYPNPTGVSYTPPSSLRARAALLAESDDGALIRTFPRVQSGVFEGFVENRSWQAVASPATVAHGPHKLFAYDYVSPIHDSAAATDVGDDYLVVRPLIEKRRSYNTYQYTTADTVYYDETTYVYEFHAEEVNGGGTTDPADSEWLVPRKVTTTHPVVSTANNGSGFAATSIEYFRADETPIFRRDETGVFYYTAFVNDEIVKTIDDVRLSITLVGTDNPINYISPVPVTAGGNELRVVTTITRDEVGRETKRVMPSGRVLTHRYEELADGRLARVSSMGEDGSSYLGPFEYRVWGDNGTVDVEAKIGVGTTTSPPDSWIDDTKSDVILAAAVGDLSEMTRFSYNFSGDTMTGRNVYHTIPASGFGDLLTNYDAESYEHDGAGQVLEQTLMTGTVHSYVRDSRGIVTDRTVSSFNPSPITISVSAPADNGGQSSDANGDEMGGYCNCTQSSTGSCLHVSTGVNNNLGPSDYQIQNDIFGRKVFVRTDTAPYYAYGYDNLGRLSSIAVYNSDDFATVSLNLASGRDELNPDVYTDYHPAAFGPDYLSANRVAYVSFDYDERGRIVRRAIHELASNGTTTGNELVWEYTYDSAGRVIFEQAEGLVKREYDRLGREIANYELSGTDDSAYAHALSVSGDVVEQETHRVLNAKTGQVLLESMTSRTENDYGSSEHRGALDSNSYSATLGITTIASITIQPLNLEGRTQIWTYSYDNLDRVTGRHIFGTGDTDNGQTFDPDAVSMPDSLDTLYGFDAAGRLAEITDPLGRIEKRAFNDAGRMIERIENYVTPPSGAPDENRTTEWTYRNNQLVEYIAHEGGATQTTTYSYAPGGTPDDNWPSREHLRSIVYPDSGIEYFVYDDYDYIDRHIDAAGNEIKFSYDLPNRVSRLDLTATTGFDDTVAALEIQYSGLGRLATVTQLDSGDNEIDSVTMGYDGWSNLSTFTQDPDGSAGSFGAQALTYVWELANSSGGRQAVRLAGKDFPSGADVDYNYTSVAGSNGGDALMSRVSSIEYDAAVVAEYEYMGVDFVRKTSYPTNTTYALYSSLQDGNGDFDALDNFNRPVRSRWNRERAANALTNELPFYDITVHWDDNSNVTGVTDNVYTDFFNYDFENDGLNRLVDSKRGGGSGNSVTLPAIEVESWGLSEIGVWDTHDLEFTGDNPPDYSDTGEFKAAGTFNSVNEMTALALDQDNDGNADVTYTRTHNDRGDLTDDGENYKFVYDVLGRMVEIRNRITNDLLSQYKYNGLGYRSGERIDTDGDGIIEVGENDWEYFIYDAQWRLIGVYQDSDDVNPTEVYVHHAAGLNAQTGSYRDHLVLRDHDTNGDDVLDELHYYCQNWRADVVAVLDTAGNMLEQARYTPYGVPILIPFADQRADGVLDFFDVNAFLTRFNASSYEVRADYNLDGQLDFVDVSGWQGQFNTVVEVGRSSISNYEHRFGFAGYWYESDRGLYHVRNRCFNPEDGRWMTRDRYDYIDGSSMYQYVGSYPIVAIDTDGDWLHIVVGAAIGAAAGAYAAHKSGKNAWAGAAGGAVGGAITAATFGAGAGAIGAIGGIQGAAVGAGLGATSGAAGAAAGGAVREGFNYLNGDGFDGDSVIDDTVKGGISGGVLGGVLGASGQCFTGGGGVKGAGKDAEEVLDDIAAILFELNLEIIKSW